MARSKYIYMVKEREGFRAATPVAVFTVKRECMEWMEGFRGTLHSVTRWHDGSSQCPTDITGEFTR